MTQRSDPPAESLGARSRTNNWRIVRIAGVVRLILDGQVWAVRDVAPTPTGNHRKFVAFGDSAAFEREFTPRDDGLRSRRYRFRSDEDQHVDLETIARELSEAREV